MNNENNWRQKFLKRFQHRANCCFCLNLFLNLFLILRKFHLKPIVQLNKQVVTTSLAKDVIAIFPKEIIIHFKILNVNGICIYWII